MLPIPTAAYWDKVPWWAYLVLVFVVVGFLPFIIKVLTGGQSFYQKREERAFASQQALDHHRDLFIATLQQDRDNARQEAARERELRIAIEQDRDLGWDLARGAEDVAHDLRHDLCGVIIRFNAMLKWMGEIISGKMTIERARLLYAEIEPMTEPPKLPTLRGYKRKGPDA